MMRSIRTRPAGHPSSPRGFSLLEIMIALALGLLLSVGIISLFGNTSRTNKLQDGLARLQENGRFAITRMEQDLRQAGTQYCSNNNGGSASGTVVPVLPARAPMVYAKDIALPDSTLHSIDGSGNPTDEAAAAAYPLSPRWFVQGYSCTAASCTPDLPSGTGQIPDMGLAEGKRVPAADVLTVRYQRGSGWPLAANACVLGKGDPLVSGTKITVSPQTGDDPVGADVRLALISDCINPAIVPISASGPQMTVGDILPGATGAMCNGTGLRDMRLFDFSNDFVTVTYYLVFRADDNPDARPNAGSARLVPVLVRRENGVEQELVRGVDQLVFRYGVQDATGNMRFLTATEVQSFATCAPPPAGMQLEPGCAWRSVRTIEPHLLLNTVDEIAGLDDASRTYRFDGESFTKGQDELLPSGLKHGSQIRREFISYISSRATNL